MELIPDLLAMNSLWMAMYAFRGWRCTESDFVMTNLGWKTFQYQRDCMVGSLHDSF